MTGRTTANSLKRPHSPVKTTRRRRNTGSGSTSNDKKTASIKDAIDTARINFEKDLRTTASSTPSSMSPRLRDTEAGSSPSGKKSSSAPASPNKSLTVMVTNNSTADQPKRARLSLRSSLSPKSPRSRRSNLLLTTTDAVAAAAAVVGSSSTTSSTPSPPTSSKGKVTTPSTESSKKVKSPPPSPSKSPSGRMLLSDSKKEKDSSKKAKAGVSMGEVIRLHQDEGVMHLLHGLPSSRRKPSHTHVSHVAASALRRRPSNEIERGPNKGHSQQSSKHFIDDSMARGGNNKKLSVRAHLLQRNTNPNNILSKGVDPAKIKPCKQEDLMIPSNLELLKQLPTRDYVRLWSSPSRYLMRTQRQRTESGGGGNPGSAASPSGSVASTDSSASALVANLNLPPVRTKPWNINTKNYKDVLIRTYPSFAQVILSPTTTGLRNSVNPNVCDELIDALKQLGNDPECRGVLVTGLGGVFCQGIDLTLLANETSQDKQKKAAEALANAIKRLIKAMLGFNRILVAAVNGNARGLGVTLLPFFDIVYANDKAEFVLDHGRLGVMPEGFATYTKIANMTEMLFMGQTLTAFMAEKAGLVNSTIWPDKFMEEVVPRMEILEVNSLSGIKGLRAAMKRKLAKEITAIMDEETKELASQWASLDFAKHVRQYLKTNHFIFQ